MNGNAKHSYSLHCHLEENLAYSVSFLTSVNITALFMIQSLKKDLISFGKLLQDESSEQIIHY